MRKPASRKKVLLISLINCFSLGLLVNIFTIQSHLTNRASAGFLNPWTDHDRESRKASLYIFPYMATKHRFPPYLFICLVSSVCKPGGHRLSWAFSISSVTMWEGHPDSVHDKYYRYRNQHSVMWPYRCVKNPVEKGSKHGFRSIYVKRDNSWN